MLSDRLLSPLPPLAEQFSNENYRYHRQGEFVRLMEGQNNQLDVAEMLPQQDGDHNDTPRNIIPPQQQRTERKFPICLHQVRKEARYDPWRHVNGAARFLAVQQRQRKKQERDHNRGVATITSNNYHLVTLLTIRRKSHLVLWGMVLLQLVAIDVYWLLPTGVILYAVSLQIAWEQWMTEIKENQRYHEQQQLERERRRQMKVQMAIQKAEFEYHVLRDRWDIEIIPIYESDIGRTVVYAVPPSQTLRLPLSLEDPWRDDV
jgi:hypothetical protein